MGAGEVVAGGQDAEMVGAQDFAEVLHGVGQGQGRLVTAYSLRNIAKLKIEEKKLKTQQEKLLKQKKKLKKELKKADDPDHIESEARRQLKKIGRAHV